MEAVESQNIRIHDLEVQLKNRLSQTPVIMDTKVEGVSMPKFLGKPQESVDIYFFQAKLYLACKRIDYKNQDTLNQKRIVAILASNFRDGEAAWYHSQAVRGSTMFTIDELHMCMKQEFLPRDKEHREEKS